jgi:hypothetical protein
VSAGVERVSAPTGTSGPDAAIFPRHVLRSRLPHQVIYVDAPIVIAQVGGFHVVTAGKTFVVDESDLSCGPLLGGLTLVVALGLPLSRTQLQSLRVSLGVYRKGGFVAMEGRVVRPVLFEYPF